MDFNFNPVKSIFKQRKQNMYTTNASICDTTGKLLFFTNGCEIAHANGETMENGDLLNPGTFRTLWCIEYGEGYNGGPQNALILPWPDSPGVYRLFHKRYIYNVAYSRCDVLFSSTVDMNANNGRGRVTEKNIPLVSDTLSRTDLVAVKHANGKDWWVVTPRRNGNEFYVLKFTKDGITDTLKQTIGIKTNAAGLPINENQGAMVFSPDGSKMFRTARYEPVMMYDFDRETGVFTNFDTIHYEYGDQFIGEVGCAVSPNNRYLYLSCRQFLYQLDLQAPDISASQTMVAEWDGFTTPFPTLFWQCQLGPDCKIYIMAGGDTRYWHVVHNPDLPGQQCDVEQRGLVLATRCGASMPAFPNYRLSTLDNPGKPCTSTVSIHAPPQVQEGEALFIYPNPASGQATVEYRLSGPRDNRLALHDLTGRQVLEIALPDNQGRVVLPLETLAPGIYWCQIAGRAFAQKLVVMR